MSLRLGEKEVPKACADILIQVRDRVIDLKKRYGSLSMWGRPYFFDVKEVAVVYYLNNKLGISVERIAGFLNVDKTALYSKYINRIESEGRFSIYDPQLRRTVEVQKIPEELINIVESDILKVKAKEYIPDPLQSSIIREFWTGEVKKRVKKPGLPTTISERYKKETLMVVRRLMAYFQSKGMSNNPDLWKEEDVVKAIAEIAQDPRTRRRFYKALRRVPQWNTWFSGLIGAEVRFVRPKERALFYKQYLQLKNAWREGRLSDAEFLVVWLHITTGAREGYTLYLPTVKLDSPTVKASLVGLRWENLSKMGDYNIIRIYEPKTVTEWSCNLAWLDSEVMNYFLSKYMKSEGNIMATLTGLKTVGDFKTWYAKTCRKIAELLGYPDLTPHDMRRSHISILAELGVPMEYALSGMTDLGVGWEDAKTALVFYLRFSEYTRELVYEKIEMNKAKIQSRMST